MEEKSLIFVPITSKNSASVQLHAVNRSAFINLWFLLYWEGGLPMVMVCSQGRSDSQPANSLPAVLLIPAT
jgi:hypothetical protein